MSKNQKELTPEQIEKAGGENNLRRLTLVDSNDNEVQVIAKVPSRTTIGEYLKFANVNPTKAQEILINKSLLTDKDLVKSDDLLFLSAVAGIAEIMPLGTAKVEKY